MGNVIGVITHSFHETRENVLTVIYTIWLSLTDFMEREGGYGVGAEAREEVGLSANHERTDHAVCIGDIWSFYTDLHRASNIFLGSEN